MRLGDYNGRWCRRLNDAKGFYDWDWEVESDRSTLKRPRRIQRLYDGEMVAQEWELRLSLWEGGWVVDTEHGVGYQRPDGTGHLGQKWPDGKAALKFDLIAKTFVDPRIKRLLMTPDPQRDANGHVSCVLVGQSETEEEIQARASSAFGEPRA